MNDATVFGPEGFPLSPKEVSRDTPGVKEGFTRLCHACQVKYIRHDAIENFLFGQDYRPESKLSIKKIKEAAKKQVKENEKKRKSMQDKMKQNAKALLKSTTKAAKSQKKATK